MFRCANKVSRLDKALILSFIAGQTDNPRPNEENVLHITLNQSKVRMTCLFVEPSVNICTR